MAKLRWRQSINDELRGKAEELKGKLTGNRAQEIKGRARQAFGEFKYGPGRMLADLRKRSG